MKRQYVIGASVGVAAIVLVIIVINRWYQTYETGPSVRAEFMKHLENGGTLTFRTSNGKMIGTDGDVDLHFFDHQHVAMVAYSVSVMTYRGTYSIDSDGVVTANFPGRPRNWPKMIIGRDAESLLLDTADGSAFYFGWRSRASNGTDHWPFRPVTDTELTQRYLTM